MKLIDLINEEFKYSQTTLKCPVCNSLNSRVVDKRNRGANGIYRRRQCENKHTYTTIEKISSLHSVNKNIYTP